MNEEYFMFEPINMCVNMKCFSFSQMFLPLMSSVVTDTCPWQSCHILKPAGRKKIYPGERGWMKIWADVYSLAAGSRKWQGVIPGLPSSHEYKLLRKSNSANWKTQGWRPSTKMGDLDVVSFPFKITMTSFSHTQKILIPHVPWHRGGSRPSLPQCPESGTLPCYYGCQALKVSFSLCSVLILANLILKW